MRFRLAAAATITAALFAGVTLFALEGVEVARLHTRAEDGSTRVTRVWVADDSEGVWVESASAERPFFLDLLRDPRLELERPSGRFAMRAEVLPNPEGHRRIRRLLLAKYGWADRWIGLLQDTSASVGLRLIPATAGNSVGGSVRRHEGLDPRPEGPLLQSRRTEAHTPPPRSVFDARG